jgi:ABC-type transport system involved in multi-copper enzyme maturation permease subunit
MRFRALMYKEFRECLPCVLLASIFLIGCGFIWATVKNEYPDANYRTFTAGGDIEPVQFSGDPDISIYNLFYYPYITPLSYSLFVFAFGLGIALGVRQYWVEFFTKTYGFLLHRSVLRSTILGAKLLAAMISFIPMAVIWTIFYLYGYNRQLFPIPPSAGTFVEGLIFVAFGFVVYLSVALAALSREKWYTTKMFSPAFAIWMLVTLGQQWQLSWAWITFFVSAVILLIQIADVFLNREFE